MTETNNLTKDYKELEGIDTSTYAGKAVAAVKTKAKGIMGDDLLIFTLLDFVSFIQLNNKFSDAGIYITDDNKEECYIKIIEMNKESLINDLETYINLKDKIKKIQEQKNEYVKIINSLKNLADLNDEKSVNEIIEEYLRK
jgi:hypothetical protein